MTRDKVYKLIDEERDYQESLQKDRRRCRKNPQHSVGDYLVMLSEYVDRAKAAWVNHPGDWAALDIIRKCAGICVNCMENHKTPPRINHYKATDETNTKTN